MAIAPLQRFSGYRFITLQGIGSVRGTHESGYLTIAFEDYEGSASFPFSALVLHSSFTVARIVTTTSGPLVTGVNYPSLDDMRMEVCNAAIQQDEMLIGLNFTTNTFITPRPLPESGHCILTIPLDRHEYFSPRYCGADEAEAYWKEDILPPEKRSKGITLSVWLNLLSGKIVSRCLSINDRIIEPGT